MSYMGTMLRVDLTRNRITEESLDEELARKFVGSRGLGAKLVFDELDPAKDPLGEESRLVFATGPLTGTRAPTSGRFTVTFKSPLTGLLTYSNCGGFFGPWIKRAGYDVIIIEGCTESPSYLLVSDDTNEICDAGELWGMKTRETNSILEKRHDGKVASIGPAGERLSPISNLIMNGIYASGRGGIGAVMGSEKLKAVVVSGDQKVQVADEKRFDRALRYANALIDEEPITGAMLRTMGTASLVQMMNMNGIYPVRNFQQSRWPEEKAELTSGERLGRLSQGRHGCYMCPILCGHMVNLPDGGEMTSPEYETVWSLGANIDNSDLFSIVEGSALCDEYGLDAISTGAAIAAAIELEERGKISEGLKWNDPQGMLDLISKIAHGSGIGADLASGAKSLCERYGAPEVSMDVKGLELPGYDPRGAQGMGLAYATSSIGGSHMEAYMIAPEVLGRPKELLDRFATRKKAEWVVDLQDLSAFVDSLVLCRFSQFALGSDNYAEMYSAAVGTEFDVADLMETGGRIYNLERLFNTRAGSTVDTLPDRLLDERVRSGPAMGRTVRLKKMLREYYALRGWSKEGLVEDWTLRRYGLGGRST
ncbi:MAG: aldehyde ferredoxin oxidoreductase family protein [Euryarchaeota archaeon]|nr:aldehyde ferredoxin oxidoreductase family protein [Euryarchaeota archaeon]